MNFFYTHIVPQPKVVLDDTLPEIPKRKMKRLVKNPAASAEAANLRYVSDKDKGIVRVREKDGFSYKLNGKAVTDEKTLARIKKLALPPAWEVVWICKDANGHLQATGVDARGRKQYKYHPAWSAMRSQTKFYHLYEFGKALPAMRACIGYDLARPGLSQEKVLAALVSIMQQTGIRIGNSEYEKLYGSFGLSTLKDKHVEIKASVVKFAFRGRRV